MSWIPFSISNVEAHPQDFIGPNVAGSFVQALETGFLLSQYIHFRVRMSQEPHIIQYIAKLLMLLSLAQTVIAFYNTWRIVVIGFGSWPIALTIQWCDLMQPAFNGAMAAPVQGFLIYRCWHAFGRRWYILFPLSTLLLGALSANISITYLTFRFANEYMFQPSRRFPPQFITAFVLTAFLDIILTALMCWFLYKARTQIVSRRLDKIVMRLLLLSWEAAVPPCTCAIAACIVYGTMSLKNFWDIFLQCIIGKLYVISFFVILNGRADLRDERDAPMNSSVGLTRFWKSGAGLRARLTQVQFPSPSQSQPQMQFLNTSEIAMSSPIPTPTAARFRTPIPPPTPPIPHRSSNISAILPKRRKPELELTLPGKDSYLGEIGGSNLARFRTIDTSSSAGGRARLVEASGSKWNASSPELGLSLGPGAPWTPWIDSVASSEEKHEAELDQDQDQESMTPNTATALRADTPYRQNEEDVVVRKREDANRANYRGRKRAWER